MVLKMMGMLILGIASVSDIRTGRVSLPTRSDTETD